jgi:hypothetical protein
MPLEKPDSFDSLMARQHHAAVNVTGADHSSWSGDLGETLKVENGVILGTATWEHAILYDSERVQKPLKEMFEHQGEKQDDKTLLRYRNAMKTVFHENSHLLAGPGTEHRDAMGPFQQPAVRALEEGITEAYSFRNLDSYIDELQLDQVAPGIKNVVGRSSYPKFTPAAQALAHNLGEVSKLGASEVLRRMNVVNAAEKWPIATDIVFEANNLHEVVPSAEVAGAKARIQAAMQEHFGNLKDIKPGALGERVQSANLGFRAFAAGQAEAQSIGQQFAAPQQAAQVKVQAQNQTQAPGRSVEPQDKAMALMTSGVAPMRSAHQLQADNRGERGSPGTPGPSRQHGTERSE